MAVDLRFGKRGSRGGPTSKARSLCQATLLRAGTHSLEELNAARQAMPHGAESWLTFSSANGAMDGAPRECRVHDIPRAQCFVPPLEPPLFQGCRVLSVG
jgi:hypothetical protein